MSHCKLISHFPLNSAYFLRAQPCYIRACLSRFLLTSLSTWGFILSSPLPLSLHRRCCLSEKLYTDLYSHWRCHMSKVLLQLTFWTAPSFYPIRRNDCWIQVVISIVKRKKNKTLLAVRNSAVHATNFHLRILQFFYVKELVWIKRKNYVCHLRICAETYLT
jgi:hypothetical protein